MSLASFKLFLADKLTIYLATHRRGVDKPDHWAIFIGRSETVDDGHTFQVVHGRPFFEYRHDLSRASESDAQPGLLEVSASANLDSGLKNLKHLRVVAIGKVKATKIDKIAQAFGRIRVVNDDEHWNCQNWTREAVWVLEGMGYVAKGTAGEIDSILAAGSCNATDSYR